MLKPDTEIKQLATDLTIAQTHEYLHKHLQWRLPTFAELEYLISNKCVDFKKNASVYIKKNSSVKAYNTRSKKQVGFAPMFRLSVVLVKKEDYKEPRCKIYLTLAILALLSLFAITVVKPMYTKYPECSQITERAQTSHYSARTILC